MDCSLAHISTHSKLSIECLIIAKNIPSIPGTTIKIEFIKLIFLSLFLDMPIDIRLPNSFFLTSKLSSIPTITLVMASTNKTIEVRSEEHTSELQSRQYLVC